MTQQMPSLPPQRPFSPLQLSPTSEMESSGGITLPPNKRQRLSPPDPSSPQPNLPTVQYLSPPPIPTSTPAFSAFNTPQPFNTASEMGSRAVPGTMGPPSRPAERPDKPDKSTDLNQLSDIISASGIDVKEEENYLAETYRNQHAATSFTTSSNSQSSSTLSPNNSFNAWPQSSAAGFGALPGAGSLNQQPVRQQTVEDEIFAKHKRAARALSESQQQHLRDPFLQMNVIRHKLHQKAFENGVRLNVEGLFDRIPDRPQALNGRTAIGPDGTGVVAVRAGSLLTENAPLGEVFALISLATKERLRSLAEDAYGLSRGRQAGSDGVVPPEWASLATGHGPAQPTTAVSTSVTRTHWDQPSALTNGAVSKNPLKRPQPSAAEARLPTPPTDTPPSPIPTISFLSPLPNALREIAFAERRAEEERLAARAKRQRGQTQSTEGNGMSDAPATPIAAIAPEPKLTKKERERQAKAGQTDEVLHKAANDAVSLAFGGGKRKKYSWLTGGGGSGLGSGSRSGTATPGRPEASFTGAGSGSSGAGAVAGGAAGSPTIAAGDRRGLGQGRRFGDWKEGSARGRGIHMRDLILALDADGKEKKTLLRCLTKLRNADF